MPVESSSLFVPVSPTTAWAVLLGATVGLTVLGMWLFAKMEHRDDVCQGPGSAVRKSDC